MQLLNCEVGGPTLAVDEGLAEGLMAVEYRLVGCETITDGRDVAGVFESNGNEARFDMSIRVMVFVGGCRSCGEGAEPAAQVD